MWTPHGSAMLADGKSSALYGANATHDNQNDLTELSVLLLGPRRLARDLHALDRQALPHGARYLEVVDVRELFDARLQRVAVLGSERFPLARGNLAEVELRVEVRLHHALEADQAAGLELIEPVDGV